MMAGNKAVGARIAAILPGLCRDRGWQAQVEVYSLLRRWPEIMDTEVVAHSHPDKITAGVLWIEVKNLAWMQQLQYRRADMLAALNARLHHAQIKEIRLRLPDKQTAALKEETATVRFLPPDPAALSTFTKLAAAVKDPACRQALIDFWYLSHACQKDEEA
ncbi:MAG: DUF721 domain-containing protein [Desulfobulbaceae bacterium]|jgi:hypothetical protein|nr:DUF721 domain-containing protein [Desulfobulbaceae bacterium]